MKRAILSILILIFSFPFFSSLFIVKIELSNYRARAIERILSIDGSQDLYQFSSLQLDSLLWVNDKEFIYEDEYFDVVKYQTGDDGFMLLAWKDREESIAKRKIKALQWSMWSNDPNVEHRLISFDNFLKSIYYISEESCIPIDLEIVKIKGTAFQERNSRLSLEVPTPPPLLFN